MKTTPPTFKPAPANCSAVLSPKAVAFLVLLEERFGKARLDLLEKRKQVQANIDKGKFPRFLEETKKIRDADWKVAPPPADLLDRRVEITGPVDRKMVINALNSGAKVFMADFEDAHSPTWVGTLEGQVNLRDAVRRTLTYRSPEGKDYTLGKTPAVLFVRPRGLHMVEKNFLVEGQPISASLFDFGLFLFHNAAELVKRGTGPYFYIPKLENHLEARWWAEVFAFAEQTLSVPTGTIRVTVLIETILAAFEMDEILYELRQWCVGLNCGRWDYIFSAIKKFRARQEFLFPDRAQITMSAQFLNAYSKLLIETCHRRGAHAMGGMAAQIPIKNNPDLHRQAMQQVRDDKQREVKLGHDGTWVSHPGMVALAREAFDAVMKTPNQIAVPVAPSGVTEKDLLVFPSGPITDAGLRHDINVCLLYLEAWLRGTGCVPLYNLMEDAATAEISRAQVWHWIRHPRANTDRGQKVSLELVLKILDEELARIKIAVGLGAFAKMKFGPARDILAKIYASDEFTEFLTLAAYPQLN
jgi:malate synthase